MGDRTLLMRKAQTAVLRALLRKRWLKVVEESGFATTDGSLGVASTGTLTEARLRQMLRGMPEGSWELVCHPGYNDAELAEVRTRLKASREVEMRALESMTERELREEFGIELAAFGERLDGARVGEHKPQ
jgi:predicted glycoside hydrolase/deacetylase ChbG (UPF0249 family)